MKKFIVETYYTCTFKTIHTLNELNESEMSKIDSRNDGEVEVVDVKLNNRKTRKVGDKNFKDENKDFVNDKKLNKIETVVEKNIINKSKNNQTGIPKKN